MKSKIKKIFPIEVNYELKNFFQYFKKKTISLNKTNKRRIFFLDAASYNNLGDQAIAYAIGEFIKDNFKEDEYIEVSESDLLRNYFYLKNNIRENDIICLSGGGNMGNLYPKYEAIRRKIIKRFKKNRIIIFPQTIDYEKDRYGKKEEKRSQKVYNSNSNLIICAREQKSYANMMNMYNNVKLIPDIVLYLCGKIKVETNKKNNNVIGICLRNDRESIISEKMKSQIMNLEMDKQELTTMSEERIIKINNRKDILISKINEFAQCSAIITDRLHGMIFAMIADVPCIAFDNSNRKVSGVYGTVSECEKKVFVATEDNDIDLMLEIQKLKQEKSNLDKDLFLELKRCFD